MSDIAQKVDHLGEKIAALPKGVRAERYALVLVCGDMAPQLKEQTTFELKSKFRSERYFEVQKIPEGQAEKTSDILDNMLENFREKINGGQIMLRMLQVDIVLAGNNFPLNKIQEIHRLVKEVMSTIDADCSYDVNDYLLMDFREQKRKAVGKDKIQETWLKEAEQFFQGEGIVPYLFTEDRFQNRQNRYRRAIQTTAALITVNMAARDVLENVREETGTWRTASYWRQDLLRYYIAEFIRKIADKRRTAQTAAFDGDGYLEKINHFFMQEGVLIDRQEAVQAIRSMPARLDPYLAKTEQGFFSKLLKGREEREAVPAQDVFETVYGKNHVRSFLNCNYGNIYDTERLKTLVGELRGGSMRRELLLGAFWDSDIGTFLDVSRRLKENAEKNLYRLREQREQYTRLDSVLYQTQISLGYHTKDAKELMETLQDNINTNNVLEKMVEAEEIERQLVVYEALYEIAQSQEFQDKLQQISKRWEEQISYLDVLKDEYFHGDEIEGIISITLPDSESFFDSVVTEPGGWQQTEFSPWLLDSVETYLWETTKCAKIRDWLHENQGKILSSFFDYVNQLQNEKLNKDLAAFRNDYLRGLHPAGEGCKFIYYHSQNLDAVKNVKIALGDVEYRVVDWLDEFSLEYFQVQSFTDMESILLQFSEDENAAQRAEAEIVHEAAGNLEEEIAQAVAEAMAEAAIAEEDSAMQEQA